MRTSLWWSTSTKSWTEARAEARLASVLERSVWLERLLVTAAVLLSVWGIGAFGIWDPWELVLTGESLGDDEWSARLPGVLAGLLTCFFAYEALRRGLSARAGRFAVVVMACTPLFVLNSRLLMGDSMGFAAQSWVGLAALALSESNGRGRTAAYLGLLACGALVSTWQSGVLLGPLPPIVAVAAWSALAEGSADENRVARWLLPTAAAVLTAGVVRAAALDAAEPSAWLGGGAVGGNPPTHDKALELIFHGFAPWSATLPIAAVWSLAPRPDRSPRTQKLAWILLLWAAFAFVAWTVFSSRYGTPPYLAVLPLAGVTAIWLAELSEEPVSRWPGAVVTTLLVALLVRDYALYPESPLRALAIDGLSVPEVYDPKRHWAATLSLAGVAVVLALVSHERLPKPRPRATVRWLEAQWRANRAARGWMLFAALLLAACLTFGLMCFLLELRIPSLIVRIGKVALGVPFILLGLGFGLPWLRYAFGRLAALRVLAALAAGLAVGAFITLSFLPALSVHFSPRPVYEAFNRLTDGRSEPLVSYRLPPDAARYYTSAPVKELSDAKRLMGYLQEGGQRWAVVQADQLAALNREYRGQTGEHLYVADARSARLLLLAARPIEGRPNQSFIAESVLREVPSIQHRVHATYEDGIELLGYDLILPEGDSVGAGQGFSLTWYWRVLGNAPPGYEVFVHIDGYGLRLNGDHEPVGGRYPTRVWETGDVIVDAQELSVPPNFRSGDYVIYVGLFSGGKRLEVESGPDDGVDRIRAGLLPVC